MNFTSSSSELDISEESDHEDIPEVSKGRSITPLSSFLTELKPKLKGNITEVRDVIISFSAEDLPEKMIFRSYTGFAASEVLKSISGKLISFLSSVILLYKGRGREIYFEESKSEAFYVINSRQNNRTFIYKGQGSPKTII